MKITVAIPTIAGRTQYLEHCLATCTAEPYSDLEILVSDNGDGSAAEVISRNGDRRIRLIRPNSYLPMSAHWDFVVSNIRGDACTIIGDDDGIMPGSIQRVVELFAMTRASAVHHGLANYFWPDCPFPERSRSIMLFHHLTQGVRLIPSSTFIMGVLRGRCRYIDGPMIYHNFVETRLLHSMLREGPIFLRSSPDMYSSMAIALRIPYFASTGRILTLSGQGARSNGASVQIGGADGAAFIRQSQSNLYRPRFSNRNFQLIMLDCIYEAARAYSAPKLVRQIAWAPNLARALGEARGHPNIRDRIIEALMTFNLGLRHGALSDLAATILRKLGKRLGLAQARSTDSLVHAPSIVQSLKTPVGVANIRDATLFLQEHLYGS